ARISGVKPLPSMTPSTITMTVRKPAAMAMGAPAMEASVVATMDPIIQGSGSLIETASQPPSVPSSSASATAGQRRQGAFTRGLSLGLESLRASGSAKRSSILGDPFAEPVHEGFAQGKLFQGNEFVRLVGLLDIAGATDDGWNARVGDQAGLGSESNCCGAVGAGECLCELDDLVIIRNIQRRKGGGLLDLDGRFGKDGLHLRKKHLLRVIHCF